MEVSGLQLLRQETDGYRVEFASRLPDRRLAGYVVRYSTYREHSTRPFRRTEVPTGNVTVIISFGPRIQLIDPSAPTRRLTELDSFVASTHATPAITEFVGAQDGLELELTPLGASRLFGPVLGELATLTPALSELWDGDPLVRRLADLSTPDERFDLLDRELPARLEGAHAPSPVAAWAWRRLRATDGRIPIGTLVEELGCSHRYLLSQFRAHVGLTPKTYARVLRCRRAIRRLESDGRAAGAGRSPVGLTTIALDCGYADHAHLDRDFRRITGVAPSAWPQAPEFDVPRLDPSPTA